MKALMDQYGDLFLAAAGAVGVIGLVGLLTEDGGLFCRLAAAGLGL